MTMYREILRLHFEGRLSQRDIAVSCRCAHSTVKRILARAAELRLDVSNTASMSDSALAKLLYPQAFLPRIQKEPDYAYVHKELAKSGVTLTLLWNEYCAKCREASEIPYMYSQFSRNYREYALLNNASMHITHKPADIMEVDWAGTKLAVHDEISDRQLKASLFVACLPFSGYCYAEAFLDEKLDSWLEAHIHACNYFGGAARIFRPDNLKTGVRKADKYDPELNNSYRELAEHYGAFVSPSRVMKPKDKASVEGAVGKLTIWIIAALRNMEFHSLSELNKEIQSRLRNFNDKPFQKKDGSRSSVFTTEEKPYLKLLPAYEYQTAHFKDITVPTSYHIQADDRKYYSVPFQYINKKVTVRTTQSLVEVFHQGERIACHAKDRGKEQYITDSAHMPETHRHLYDWNSGRFQEWGAAVGTNTLAVIKDKLAKNGCALPGYKFCMGLVSLGKKHTFEEIEDACAMALRLSSFPSLKSVKLALAACKSRNAAGAQTGSSVGDTSPAPQIKGFRRGSGYYGGKCDD